MLERVTGSAATFVYASSKIIHTIGYNLEFVTIWALPLSVQHVRSASTLKADARLSYTFRQRMRLRANASAGVAADKLDPGCLAR